MELPRPPVVSIDEQMIPFTRTTQLKVFVPNKPNPEGLKNWVLASPNGLVLDFEVSQGKSHLVSLLNDLETEKKIGLGEAVVLRLSESLSAGKCHYYDRYFSTIKLLDCLSDKVFWYWYISKLF